MSLNQNLTFTLACSVTGTIQINLNGTAFNVFSYAVVHLSAAKVDLSVS